MDKTAIKNFAVNARKKLMKQVKQKAFEIGIEKDNIVKPHIKGEDSVKIHNRYLDKKEIKQRDRLIREIERKGYQQVIEEVSYTWFNRFVALRFMEVNGYLPTGVRILSSKEEGKVEPDIIKEALNVDLNIDQNKVFNYQDNNDTEGLFRYLLIKQCNSLNDIMPFIFEKISDYTEILLPDNLLSEGSVIRDMVDNIREENWKEVKIIGWIYQYYISEKKDEVFGSKGKFKKEEIPAVTQLFTPDWIVRYMVENSLGRYWLESNPNENKKNNWEYYLEEAEQEPEVREKLKKTRVRNFNPENITFLDPAAGSGHILVYAFEFLYEIYRSVGYLESEIPKLILNNNLYGLEICERAAQLASLSVMMKARQKDSRIFEKEVNLNIISIQESNIINQEAIDLLVDNIEGNKQKNKLESDLNYLVDLYKNAKNYGSILQIEKDISIDLIINALKKLKDNTVNLFGGANRNIIVKLFPNLLKQYKIMNNKYDIVVTNPPYMGRKGMNNKLNKYLKNNYNDSKNDLFAVFIERCRDFVKKEGYVGMITQHAWMFNPRYKRLRKKLLTEININTMAHLGPGAFDDISGEVVQTVAFSFELGNHPEYKGIYCRLIDFSGEKQKKLQFLNRNNMYTAKFINFWKIPGKPVAYWVKEKVINIFENNKNLSSMAKPKVGLQTGNNKKFIREWFEVDIKKIDFNFTKGNISEKKWFPIKNGGTSRKWYGNNNWVVDWKDNGYNIKQNKLDKLNKGLIAKKNSKCWNERYYFKKGITWSVIGSSLPTFRFSDKGFVYGNSGNGIFVNKNKKIYIVLAYLNSKVAYEFLKILTPTLGFGSGQISKLPLVNIDELDESCFNHIDKICKNNINISKTDWDSFEKSWDFKKHPLLTYQGEDKIIEEAFNKWSEFAENQFYQLKENEEKLNEIFIDIYDLQDELDPEVEEKDITVRKADRARDIRFFMSYAVGCMFGRYSLDEEGLVYAGGEFDLSRYKTFKADEDNIIPVLDEEYFDDDIVSKFVEFVKVTFGEEHLEENLEYIADSLIEGGTTGQDTARDTIRKYFLFDFIKDHVSTYNKRPIYWLFQSDGRGKAFNALIYMHRYDKHTVARVRTDYLHELQSKIEAEKSRLRGIIDSDLSTREKSKAKKRLSKLEKDTKELRDYDEKLNHLANKQIEIDLDDGVKENYKKFDEVLKNI